MIFISISAISNLFVFFTVIVVCIGSPGSYSVLLLVIAASSPSFDTVSAQAAAASAKKQSVLQ